MHLQQLLNGIFAKVYGPSDITLNHLSLDSRIPPGVSGSLFAALRGTYDDGHHHIQSAIQAGYTAILCDQLPVSASTKSITYIVVPSSAEALGKLAGNYYGNPSKKLQVVAVTGTNGKTSTVHFLHGIFTDLGYNVGLLSTIHNKIKQKIYPASLTTPDVLQLHELMNHMVSEGCTYCFMEASSHALVQQRLAGVHLTGGVFTNLTHDHLDYHKSFAEYILAKKKLFDQLPRSGFALINTDDKNGRIMVQNTIAQVQSFALRTPADYTAKILSNTLQGMELKLNETPVWTRLFGRHNAYNLLAAYSVARQFKISDHEILKSLSKSLPAPGRLSHIATPFGWDVYIDYAHTPDALTKIIKTLHQVKNKKGRIICITGCGGNRDVTKRPLMARAAYEYSDIAIFTSDNPRNEPPENIIQDMMSGLSHTQQKNILVIIDRTEAIQKACLLAKPGDIVLIAGKGHETYQIIKNVRYPFNDQDVIEQYLQTK